MLAKLVECGHKGLTVAQTARELGIARRIMFNWRQNNPEFAEAFEDYKDACQAHWEDMGKQVIMNKDLNGNMWSWQMLKRFPDDYGQEKQKIELSGDPEGAPIKVEVNNAVEAAIAALRAHKEE